MDYTYESYTKVRPLASHIKQILSNYGSRIPSVVGRDVFTEENLISYIGGLFDIIDNRKLLIKQNKIAGTFKSLLTSAEYELFIKSLKEHNTKLYGHLLTTKE